MINNVFFFLCQYCVARFLELNPEDESVEVCPNKWVNATGTQCKWPPKGTPGDTVKRWVMGLMDAKENFRDLDIKVMFDFSE